VWMHRLSLKKFLERRRSKNGTVDGESGSTGTAGWF
jgi:hypothetical protein